jgi:hypothetical protein
LATSRWVWVILQSTSLERLVPFVAFIKNNERT